MKTYRDFIKNRLTKRVRDQLRTTKRAGDVEIVWDSRLGDYRKHVHEGETPSPPVKLSVVPKDRKAA